MHRESRFRCSRKTRLTRERAVVRRTRSWTQLVIISTEEIDLKRAQDMYLRKKKKEMCATMLYGHGKTKGGDACLPFMSGSF